MKPNASTAALPKKNDGTLSRHKCTKHHRNIQYSATKNASFAALDNLRQTEMQQARALFLSNPDASYTRAGLVDVLDKPLSHVCRIVFDLIEEGIIEVCGRAVNPTSGRTVEVVKLKPRSMTVTEQSLFDRMGGGAL